MWVSVVVVGFRYRGDGRVAVVPDIALMCEVVETCNGENYCKSCYSPSSKDRHCVECVDGRVSLVGRSGEVQHTRTSEAKMCKIQF